MAGGYGVTAGEVAAVGRLFGGHVQSIADQAAAVAASTVGSATVGIPFRAEGEAYAALVGRLRDAVSEFATRIDAVASGLRADADAYEAAESDSAAGFGRQ